MSFSTSPLSFNDVKAALNRALESPKGIRITFENNGRAVAFIQRANYWRLQDRKESKTIFPDTHPQHGTSIYDGLILGREENIAIFKPRTGDELVIEEIE